MKLDLTDEKILLKSSLEGFKTLSLLKLLHFVIILLLRRVGKKTEGTVNVEHTLVFRH